MSRTPLQPGTQISYLSVLATVVEDNGGETLWVSVSKQENTTKDFRGGNTMVANAPEGLEQWRWNLNGIECEVVE